MIHFGHPKPTANNQKPYSDDKWHMLKDKHKLDKMLFSILDLEFNDDFYSIKLRLNPLDEAPLARFEWALEKWIQSRTPKKNSMKTILLGHSHYKYDIVEDMAGLLDVIDKESCMSFLMDNVTKTITIIFTTHNTKGILIVWKGPDWESFFLRLLNVRAMFKVVAYIYNRESFKSPLTIVCKSKFNLNLGSTWQDKQRFQVCQQHY
jgi:hypothetical protein